MWCHRSVCINRNPNVHDRIFAAARFRISGSARKALISEPHHLSASFLLCNLVPCEPSSRVSIPPIAVTLRRMIAGKAVLLCPARRCMPPILISCHRVSSGFPTVELYLLSLPVKVLRFAYYPKTFIYSLSIYSRTYKEKINLRHPRPQFFHAPQSQHGPPTSEQGPPNPTPANNSSHQKRFLPYLVCHISGPSSDTRL